MTRKLPGDPHDVTARATGGDAPPQPARLPYEPETVLIPAGPFLMGSDKETDPQAYDSECPEHTVALPEYRIGKYPVTVGEYRAFIKAQGYGERRFWTAAGWQFREQKKLTSPRFWLFGTWATNPRFPVIGVSWYEAAAYTCWLSEATGRSYRLPSEAEWEKAARGTDGRIYTWGTTWREGLCNWQGSGIQHTTPVGDFSPASDSPYGVADMSGNVRTWCATKWRWRYPVTEDNTLEGIFLRCLRGGAWDYDRFVARCATRSGIRPSYATALIGLRVCEAVSQR
jgi:formylglycine-generating enzyme required for sulfatase activity